MIDRIQGAGGTKTPFTTIGGLDNTWVKAELDDAG